VRSAATPPDTVSASLRRLPGACLLQRLSTSRGAVQDFSRVTETGHAIQLAVAPVFSSRA